MKEGLRVSLLIPLPRGAVAQQAWVEGVEGERRCCIILVEGEKESGDDASSFEHRETRVDVYNNLIVIYVG